MTNCYLARLLAGANRRPGRIVFVCSFFGPLLAGMLTAAIGLGFPPGVLAGVVLLFAVILSVPDRLMDWLDAPMRQNNFDGWSFSVAAADSPAEREQERSAA